MKAGKEVEVKVTPVYGDDTSRPVRFRVVEKITDTKTGQVTFNRRRINN